MCSFYRLQVPFHCKKINGRLENFPVWNVREIIIEFLFRNICKFLRLFLCIIHRAFFFHQFYYIFNFLACFLLPFLAHYFQHLFMLFTLRIGELPTTKAVGFLIHHQKLPSFPKVLLPIPKARRIVPIPV